MKIKMHIRSILLFTLALALCLTACAPALAAVGDRTLTRVDVNDGSWSRYIQTVLVNDGKICVFVQDNSDLDILVYTDVKADPESYVLKDFYGYTYEPQAEEDAEEGEYASAATQTTGWVAYNGEVYALQYKDIYRNGESDVEGGWLRRLVLADGEARLEDSGLPQLDWTSMIEDYGSSKGARWANRVFMAGDKLCCVCYTNSGELMAVLFDLETGFSEEVVMDNSPQVYPSTDGFVLLSRYDWSESGSSVKLSLMDLAAQSEQQLGQIPLESGYFQSMYYDRAGDRLIYSLDGQIMVAPGGDLTLAESVNDSPPDYDMQMDPLPDGFMLMWNSSTVAVRNTDPTQRSTISLSVLDAASSDNLEAAIYDFTNKRGDVSVALKRTYGDSSVLQAMMNRDASVDIYCYGYQDSAMEALRNRGFLADLSGNAEVAEAVGRMYPYLQKAVRQGEKITMLPVSLYGWTLGYDPKAWAKIGLTEADLPRTWDQFFDLLETLPEKTQGTDYQALPFGEVLSNFRYSVVTSLFEQYQLYMNRSGSPDYAFNTPLLRGLLARLDAVDYEALGMIEEYDDNYYNEYNYRDSVLQLSTSSVLQSWPDSYKALPLSLTEDSDPILPVNLSVAFINPYSEHQAEAAEFLASTLANFSTVTQYNFFTDKTEPLRTSDFEERKENTQKWLEEARASLETAGEESKTDWETTVKDIEESLADMDKNDWMFSPEGIASYQALSAWMEALDFNLYTSITSTDSVTSEYMDPIWNYAEGKGTAYTAEELLSAIDKKVQMMRLEGN